MSEKSEARRDGSRLQANSGRGQYAKGDALRELFVVDYKEYARSFGLSLDMWSKVCTDAARVDRERHPLLKVILGSGNKVRLAVLSWALFEQMEEVYLRYLRGELVESGDSN